MGFEHYYHALANQAERLHVGADKFVHMQVGLAIWVVAAIVLRRPLHSLPPLLLCIAAEVGNEIMDFRYAHSLRLPDTLTDMLATWFWPVTLFLLLRFFPRFR
jgi:hypothetical protein